MLQVDLIREARAPQPVGNHDVGQHQADAVGGRQGHDAELRGQRHTQQQRKPQEQVAEDEEAVALDRVREVLQRMPPGFQRHHQAHHQDEQVGIGTILALGQPQVQVTAARRKEGGGQADQHQVDGERRVGDGLGLLVGAVGRIARCHHRTDHAVEELGRQVALQLVEDGLRETEECHLDGGELVAGHQTVHHAAIGQDDEALGVALDAEVNHPAHVVVQPFTLKRNVGVVTGAIAAGLVDAPGHHQGTDGLVEDLDEDQVGQRHLLGPDQAHHTDELADGHGGEGRLTPLLLQHRLQDLELGVGGGAEQHDQHVELQGHHPPLQAHPVGQPQGEDHQHDDREQDQQQAQAHGVADEPAQRPGVAQVEDLGHETGEDLPGTDRREGEQHLGQAQQHGVGRELFDRQMPDGEQQGTDAGHGGQRLAHQEVFHAGSDTPRTIRVVIGVFRHGICCLF